MAGLGCYAHFGDGVLGRRRDGLWRGFLGEGGWGSEGEFLFVLVFVASVGELECLFNGLLVERGLCREKRRGCCPAE